LRRRQKQRWKGKVEGGTPGKFRKKTPSAEEGRETSSGSNGSRGGVDPIELWAHSKNSPKGAEGHPPPQQKQEQTTKKTQQKMAHSHGPQKQKQTPN